MQSHGIRQLIARLREKWHPLWRLRKFKVFRFLQRKLDFTRVVELADTDTKVALRFIRDLTWVTAFEQLEPAVKQAFSDVCSTTRPAVFWDVGANIGYYSWLMRKVPSIQSIVMIEPDPTNSSLIQKTIAVNNIRNCQILQTVLSDTVGYTQFLIDDASGATGTIAVDKSVAEKESLQHRYGMTRTIMLRSTTADALIAEGFPPPDFMKVDVEGAELRIINGARDLLNQHPPVIIMECSDQTSIDALKEIGYTVSKIDDSNYLFVPRRESVYQT